MSAPAAMPSPAATPALVEALFWATFPDGQPVPRASVTIKTAGSVEIVLDGDESPLFRVVALAMLAATLDDEDGPEMIPGVSRYTCGAWRDVFFLISTPIDAAQQRELETLGRRIADEVGE